MKNIFYLSGAIAFAIISFHFLTIQIKSNSETCKHLAEEIDNHINLSVLSKGIAKMESTDKAKYSTQEIRTEVAVRAKRYSEIYNDYCKF